MLFLNYNRFTKTKHLYLLTYKKIIQKDSKAFFQALCSFYFDLKPTFHNSNYMRTKNIMPF